MRNIGKHNNCNDETREKLEPKLPERQKWNETTSIKQWVSHTEDIELHCWDLMQQKWRTKTNQLYWKLVATNVPWLATFKTSYQTSAEELLWSEWDYRQSIKGQGLISHSKWALRSFYCEHHSHTYLSTLTNMHTHSLRGSVSHPRTHTGGSRLKPPTFPLVDEPRPPL